MHDRPRPSRDESCRNLWMCLQLRSDSSLDEPNMFLRAQPEALPLVEDDLRLMLGDLVLGANTPQSPDLRLPGWIVLHEQCSVEPLNGGIEDAIKDKRSVCKV